MGIRVTKQAAPATQAANKSEMYFDTADNRWKAIDEFGETHQISETQTARNYLVNGGFDIAQRQVPITLTSYAATADRTYAFDRWALSIQTSSLQAQQVDTIATPVAGITAPNYMRLLQITGAGKFMLSQVVEGNAGAPLRGRTVRVQFKAKRAVSALTVRMALIELSSAGTVDTITNPITTAWGANSTDPTLGANLAKVAPVTGSVENGSIVNGAAQFVLGTTFLRYGANFALTSTAKNYIVAIWSDSQLAISDDFWITEAGLYDLMIPQDWAIDPLDQILLGCQRFYEKSFPLLLLPAASVAVATGGTGRTGIIGKAGATALAAHIPIVYLVRKRTVTPTVTLFTPVNAGAVPMRIDGTTPAVQTAVAQVGPTDLGVTVTATGDAAGAVGDLVGVHFTASAEI